MWMSTLCRQARQLSSRRIEFLSPPARRIAMNWIASLPLSLQTVLLLVASNVFMTFAW